MVTVLQTDRLLLRRFETGDSTADARSSRRSAQGHIPSDSPTGFSRRNAQDPKRARLPWRGIANLTVLPAADIQSPLVREGPLPWRPRHAFGVRAHLLEPCLWGPSTHARGV